MRGWTCCTRAWRRWRRRRASWRGAAMTAPLRAAQRFGGSMLIELHCRRCGALFTPGAEATRAGGAAYRRAALPVPPVTRRNGSKAAWGRGAVARTPHGYRATSWTTGPHATCEPPCNDGTPMHATAHAQRRHAPDARIGRQSARSGRNGLQLTLARSCSAEGPRCAAWERVRNEERGVYKTSTKPPQLRGAAGRDAAGCAGRRGS